MAIRPPVGAVRRQPAITSLTDSTAGTADDAVGAIPNPADTPLSSDALRDDLVANVLPAIRNALADLTAKQNAVLEALRDANIVESS